MRAVKRQGGQSLIEVTVGIIILCSVMLVLVDLSVILLSVQSNDETCRNAARAAASGNPKEARYRAETVIDGEAKGRNETLISAPRLILPVQTKITNAPETEIDVATGTTSKPGGAVTGTATVTTEIAVKPFIVHLFCGGKTPLTFRTNQSFPISYVEPPEVISQGNASRVQDNNAY